MLVQFLYLRINIDDEIFVISIKKSITKKTKAILVHYGGYPAKMKEICKIAKDGLKVIEDCAHALGASLDSNNAGSYGDLQYFLSSNQANIYN